MIKRMTRTWIFWAGLVFMTSMTAAGADLTISVGDIMGTTVKAGQAQRTYALKLMNSSPKPLSDVKAVIIQAPAGVAVVDGEVALPKLDANHYAIPSDNFILSTAKKAAIQGKPMILKWKVQYTDSSGLQRQTVVTASSF